MASSSEYCSAPAPSAGADCVPVAQGCCADADPFPGRGRPVDPGTEKSRLFAGMPDCERSSNSMRVPKAAFVRLHSLPQFAHKRRYRKRRIPSIESNQLLCTAQVFLRSARIWFKFEENPVATFWRILHKLGVGGRPGATWVALRQLKLSLPCETGCSR